jgi:putative colanic acid biosynthesis acetyltransferase WcaF
VVGGASAATANEYTSRQKHRSVEIQPPTQLELPRHARRLELRTTAVLSNLEMGDYSVLGAGVQVYNLAPISIGSNCVISQDSYLCSATHDYTDPAFPLESRPITVHSGAWIAAKVFVAPGITIGEGAVVGACSVVTRPVPPWMVCAGNPCRPIKPRVLKD